MKTINVAIMGFGPHARKTYVKEFEKLGNEHNIIVSVLVDIAEKETEALEFCKDYTVAQQTVFLAAPDRPTGEEYVVPEEFTKILTILCKEKGINTVFIASEPISHRYYIDWALEMGFHIFLDKPATLYPHASTDIVQAKKISEDYDIIMEQYRKTADKTVNGKPVVFSCLAQRRYHPGFLEMKQFIKEVFEKTGCPVTSVSAMHSDGQWRLPDELFSENYHGYNEGVGKISHSGYHLIDSVPWLLQAAQSEDKKIDSAHILAEFARPNDILAQLSDTDIQKIFPKYRPKLSRSELSEKMKDFGEVNAHVNVNFLHDEHTITNISYALLHHSFSARDWLDTAHDPLVNKGRLKQESMYLYMGPYAAIHYHCYRASKRESFQHYEIGGLFHTEAFYFRNPDMLGSNEPHVKKIEYRTPNPPQTLQETSRVVCVKEFLDAVRDFETKDTVLASSFENHASTIKLMSAIYCAAATGFKTGTPYYKTDFTLQNPPISPFP